MFADGAPSSVVMAHEASSAIWLGVFADGAQYWYSEDANEGHRVVHLHALPFFFRVTVCVELQVRPGCRRTDFERTDFQGLSFTGLSEEGQL